MFARSSRELALDSSCGMQRSTYSCIRQHAPVGNAQDVDCEGKVQGEDRVLRALLHDDLVQLHRMAQSGCACIGVRQVSAQGGKRRRRRTPVAHMTHRHFLSPAEAAAVSIDGNKDTQQRRRRSLNRAWSHTSSRVWSLEV
jgi:hypothetical protein